MPSFSGYKTQTTAKGGVVSDGEFYTTSGSAGAQKVAVIPSTYSAFLNVPVRTGTGVWKVTMRDPAYKVQFAQVTPFTTAANAVGVVMQPNTTDSSGRLVLNWTFCTIGTNTPADIAAAQVFNVYVEYSEASIA